MNDAMIDLSVQRLGFAEPGDTALVRSLAVEAPVSIEVSGIGYAVMMATPYDLEDYALGFALSEGLIETPDQIERIDAHPVEGGWALRLWVPADRKALALERARQRVSESSCGLCGIENIEQVLRPLPPLTARIATDRSAIAAALAALRDHQPLGQATGAVHAAAFCSPAGDILCAREDVGRHNALDKLIGAAARGGLAAARGIVAITSRVSIEMVQKTAVLGCPVLVAVSAPTDLAIATAEAAGIALVAVAREDGFEVFTHADRVIG